MVTKRQTIFLAIISGAVSIAHFYAFWASFAALDTFDLPETHKYWWGIFERVLSFPLLYLLAKLNFSFLIGGKDCLWLFSILNGLIWGFLIGLIIYRIILSRKPAID